MTLSLSGQHLIDGQWTGDGATFASTPVTGDPLNVVIGTEADVAAAVTAAARAFETFGQTPRDTRAAFLDAIAGEIDARGDAITEIGSAETGLPAARLEGERGRTTGQLRLFAEVLRDGAYLDRRHDTALPDRTPLPRPDLRMIQRPIGPVAVFGASNFPLAFSTAGGDTASALAAGCPVVVKGHEAHPGTGEIVAQAILAAIGRCGLDTGVFNLVHGGSHAVGGALVRHPAIKAVGFTGSLRGGRALFDLCAARPEPIPFFGELGSVNPVILMPHALSARAAAIGTAWAGSLTMGVGQFCTNPGLILGIDGPDLDAFVAAAEAALAAQDAATMLTEAIADAAGQGADRIAATDGVTTRLRARAGPRQGAAALFDTDAGSVIANPDLTHEVFGPVGLVVRAQDLAELRDVLAGLEGQLTATLHLDDADTEASRSLMPVLERMAGRVLANGFPTGVEVASAMVHGGPYPASTNFGATSVGTLAIRRWLRPVCYQNMPAALLPDDLQGL